MTQLPTLEMLRLFGLLLLLVLSACTTRHRVPQSALPCTNACKATQQQCGAKCAESTNRPAIVEDTRQYLCDKRCTEEFEQCMLNCPGVD